MNIWSEPFLDPEPFKCEGSITLTLFVSCVVCRVSCPEKFLVDWELAGNDRE